MFCKGHSNAAKRPYGRVDGLIPLEGLLRFRAAAQRSGTVLSGSGRERMKRARGDGGGPPSRADIAAGQVARATLERLSRETPGAGRSAVASRGEAGSGRGRDAGPMTRRRARAAAAEVLDADQGAEGVVEPLAGRGQSVGEQREAAAAAAERRLVAEEQRGIGDVEAARRMRQRAEAAEARQQEANQERARARMGRGSRGSRSGSGRGASSNGGR